MSVTIHGIADVNRILGQIAPKEARNLMRVVVFDIAKTAAAAAKRRTPVDTGDLVAAIKAKRGRGQKDRVEAAVVVQGKRASAKFLAGEAYYWRALEYGAGPDHVEHAMFAKTLEEMRPNMSRIYVDAFAKRLIARLVRERKRLG